LFTLQGPAARQVEPCTAGSSAQKKVRPVGRSDSIRASRRLAWKGVPITRKRRWVERSCGGVEGGPGRPGRGTVAADKAAVRQMRAHREGRLYGPGSDKTYDRHDSAK